MVNLLKSVLHQVLDYFETKLIHPILSSTHIIVHNKISVSSLSRLLKILMELLELPTNIGGHLSNLMNIDTLDNF